MMGQMTLASEASLPINREDMFYSDKLQDGENGRATKETQVKHSQFRASGTAQLGVRKEMTEMDSRALGASFHTVS